MAEIGRPPTKVFNTECQYDPCRGTETTYSNGCHGPACREDHNRKHKLRQQAKKTPQDDRAKAYKETKPMAEIIVLNSYWQRFAACRGKTDIMFPDIESNRYKTDEARYRKANLLCKSCPVLLVCLEDSIVNEQNSNFSGYKAGMTPDERRIYVKRARKRRNTTITFASNQRGQSSFKRYSSSMVIHNKSPASG